jgi:hypothetical protein
VSWPQRVAAFFRRTVHRSDGTASEEHQEKDDCKD